MTTQNKRTPAKNKTHKDNKHLEAIYFKKSGFKTVDEFCRKFNIIQPNPVEVELGKYDNWRKKRQKDKNEWRQQLPAVKFAKDGKFFVDEYNKNINVPYYEKFEQYLVYRWIKPTDIVLELGSRYGVVSCSVNSMLSDKTQHVVVEPDDNVLVALKKNKKTFNCKFKICRKIISNTPIKYIRGEGIDNHIVENDDNTTDITQQADIISTAAFFKKYPFKFNVLVLDCEGCFLKFLRETGRVFIGKLRMIIFEKDWEEICDYKLAEKILIDTGFKCVDSLLDGFQQVWCRPGA